MITFIIIVLALVILNVLLLMFSCNKITKGTEKGSHFSNGSMDYPIIMVCVLIILIALFQIFSNKSVESNNGVVNYDSKADAFEYILPKN